MKNKIIHQSAGVVILKKNKILLIRSDDSDNTFLPNIKIQKNENYETELKKNMKYLFGIEIEFEKYAGTVEKIIETEISFEISLFKIFLVNGDNFEIKEDKDIIWCLPEELEKLKLLPSDLNKILPKLVKNKNIIFWNSTNIKN